MELLINALCVVRAGNVTANSGEAAAGKGLPALYIGVCGSGCAWIAKRRYKLENQQSSSEFSLSSS